ncbi:replication initiation protein [Variovorax sp. ZS18.2.2]|uniref:replication initiation protein n=1 Tax=Variovorax sp. ZS18.2.2 TaxID=2971255 RepID=UPI00215097F2|nr:replication initiation protein [Variovorax sp. ZS18.2.2]MCR6481072.1 replication initiation protein [Variovorax sp. ZS18.2.2]
MKQASSAPRGRQAEPVDKTRALAPAQEPDPPLRKPVNTLAMVPKSQKITTLGRKSWNVLLREAQNQGLEKDVFSAPFTDVIKGLDYDSKDHELIKKHLRSMVSTTVEWQSPTTGEGAFWTVCGLLAHAKLSKIRGQVWVEWSYAVNMKQELLEPSVFARLSMEIISQMRSHAGMALYEICTRYKDIGRTSRQSWHWWRPVLMGRPENEKTAKMEYRIFKRDCLRLAVAEVCAITDIDVELVEHKSGRFIDELQFLIRPKPQRSLALSQRDEPVDFESVARAGKLGVDDKRAEALIDEFGNEAFAAGLEALEKRITTAFPEPLRDPFRYLKSLMPGEAKLVVAKKEREAEEADGSSLAARQAQAKRQARWAEEWLRRRRATIVEEISAFSDAEQAALSSQLLADMKSRDVHPSIRKRLETSGWKHDLVVAEMVRYYARGAHGDDWDKPTSEQLLAIASEAPA